jgi:hypothetical protein
MWLENLKGRDNLRDPVTDVRIIKWILRKYDERLSIGFTQFRIGASGRIL